jgi:hypothetical protein
MLPVEISTTNGSRDMRYRNRITTARERMIAAEVRNLELRQARWQSVEVARSSIRSTSPHRSR